MLDTFYNLAASLSSLVKLALAFLIGSYFFYVISRRRWLWSVILTGASLNLFDRVIIEWDVVYSS